MIIRIVQSKGRKDRHVICRFARLEFANWIATVTLDVHAFE
jgi:hypothetical protein